MTTANVYDIDERNAELLKSWLDAGKWSREQATLLFLDIDPDRVNGECFAKFSGHGSIQYDYCDDDDPRSRIPTGVDGDGEPVYLTTEQETLLHKTKRMCKKIERKINQHEEAKPREWIDLALEKDIHIPWLDWAKNNNIYTSKETTLASSKDASATNTPPGTGKVGESEQKQSGPKAINEIHQEWQNKLESMAAELIKQKKKSFAKKGSLARRLALETGEEAGTIERNTRKTW